MTTIRTRVNRCVDFVHQEYRDLPGLQLTEPQIRRFLGVDAATCDAVLHCLEEEHFLRHTSADDWVLDGLTDSGTRRH